MEPSRNPLPETADVVVIGGGVMGLSASYHLARAGVERVVVLEQDTLGSGSTCRAAGGVRAQFSDAINVRLGQRSLETFVRFAHDFGQEIDLHQVGYLFLLDSDEAVATFEENVALQNSLGVPSRMLGVEEAVRLSPLVDPAGLKAAAYSPDDGHCTPEAVILGYAGAARRTGVRIVTGCTATGITRDGDRIVGVETERGTVRTSTVVCAAGAWSRQVGTWVGVDLPVEPLRRQIVVTEPVPGLDPATPFTIDFATSFYFHAEGQGLLMGMPEPEDRWGFDVGRDDAWLGHLAEAMTVRTPSLADVGVASGWAGLYEMTPDHNALVGEADGVSRFLYATGFSGHGFLMGPAVGEVIRDLYLGEAPFVDVTALDARRFAAAAARPEINIV